MGLLPGRGGRDLHVELERGARWGGPKDDRRVDGHAKRRVSSKIPKIDLEHFSISPGCQNGDIFVILATFR